MQLNIGGGLLRWSQATPGCQAFVYQFPICGLNVFKVELVGSLVVPSLAQCSCSAFNFHVVRLKSGDFLQQVDILPSWRLVRFLDVNFCSGEFWTSRVGFLMTQQLVKIMWKTQVMERQGMDYSLFGLLCSLIKIRILVVVASYPRVQVRSSTE